MKRFVSIAFFIMTMISAKVSASIPAKSNSKTSTHKNSESSSMQNKYQSLRSIAFSKNESMQNRWAAIMKMADIKGKDSILDLKTLAGHDEWFLKNSALIAINKISLKESTALAKKLLSDKALVVRSMAVEILKENLSKEIRELFWSELEKPYNYHGKKSLWVRKQIFSILAQSPQLSEEIKFSKYLNDSDREVTQVAYKTYTENFKSLVR
ncbi:MAG TPA: HEAT repeat domain-containing protein [Pseudobdellovibrionaceae bacterium]|nr:HEAT repeat domain-containing protein [Pseudobdellovibrionaceae bacterium]